MIEQRPIPNSYWVQAGRFLAGEYPRTPDEEASRIKLRRLLQADIIFFLDLTEAEEYHLKPYTSLLQEEATALGRSVTYRRLPIQDLRTPTNAKMKRILDTIDEVIAAGQAIYVHCFGGIGRTATVVGCYLVRHGRDGEAALAEIARLRQGTPTEWRTAPETEIQRQMVRNWPFQEPQRCIQGC